MTNVMALPVNDDNVARAANINDAQLAAVSNRETPSCLPTPLRRFQQNG